MDPSKELEHLTEAFTQGTIGKLLSSDWRDRVRTPLSKRQVTVLGGRAARLLRSRRAQYNLLHIDLVGAATALDPWVSNLGEGKVGLKAGPVEALEKKAWNAPEFDKGVVLSQLANFCYRARMFKEGVKCAKGAEEHLAWSASGSDEFEILIARCQGQIWLARLLWRLDDPVAAKRTLDNVHKELTVGYARGKAQVGGLDLLTALALTVAASFERASGNVEEGARALIYRAIALFRCGTIDDPIRLAYALCTASRVAANFRLGEAYWPMRYIEESIEIFDRASHPFRLRARLQRAQCLLEGGLHTATKGALEEVVEQLDELHPLERQATEHQAELLRILLLENGNGGNDGWEEIRVAAKNLSEVTASASEVGKPRRVAIDASIHYGRAVLHASPGPMGSEQFDLALEILSVAEEDARLGSHQKETIAACLALAEYYLIAGEAGLAEDRTNVARRMLVSCDSRYLRERLCEVEQSQSSFSIVLFERMGFADAVRKFKRDYVSHVIISEGGNRKAAAKAIGMSPANLYKVLAKDS